MRFKLLIPSFCVLLLLVGPAVSAEEPVRVDIMNAKAPWPGMLLGGQPTPDQLKQAAAVGYKTVINLRTTGELEEWDEKAVVEGLGMGYVSVPVQGKQGMTEDNARSFAQALQDAGSGPVLVHCASGNRVGGLFALKAFYVDGEPAENAFTIGQEAGMRASLEPTIRQILGIEDSSE